MMRRGERVATGDLEKSHSDLFVTCRAAWLKSNVCFREEKPTEHQHVSDQICPNVASDWNCPALSNSVTE